MNTKSVILSLAACLAGVSVPTTEAKQRGRGEYLICFSHEYNLIPTNTFHVAVVRDDVDGCASVFDSGFSPFVSSVRSFFTFVSALM